MATNQPTHTTDKARAIARLCDAEHHALLARCDITLAQCNAPHDATRTRAKLERLHANVTKAMQLLAHARTQLAESL